MSEQLARMREKQLKRHGNAKRELKKRLGLIAVNKVKGARGHKSGAGFTLLELLIAASIFSVSILVATSLFVATTKGQKRVQSLSKVQGDARFVLESMAQAVRVEGIDYSYYLDPNGDRSALPLNLNGAVKELTTRGAQGTRSFYKWISGGSPDRIGFCTQTAAEIVSDPTKCRDDANYKDITPQKIRITDFKVWIDPGSDPYAPPPTRKEDCRTNAVHSPPTYGYDQARGVCTCSQDSDCFGDGRHQQCDTTQGICVAPNSQPRATIEITSKGGSAQEGGELTVTLQTTVSSRIYRR